MGKWYTTFLLLLWILTIHARVIFLDSFLGNDGVTCGNMTSPCKSLDIAWFRAMLDNFNSTKIMFVLNDGVYESNKFDNQCIKYGVVTVISANEFWYVKFCMLLHF